MLKLHVTTKYLFWGVQEDCEMWRRRQRKQNKRAIWFPLRPCCNMGEITHCQSMKGSFPRDCLISAYLHLLADRSQSGADACEHAGRLYTDHL